MGRERERESQSLATFLAQVQETNNTPVPPAKQVQQTDPPGLIANAAYVLLQLQKRTQEKSASGDQVEIDINKI